MPLISVGMPVYNGEAYLRDALDSLLSQTFRNFELIISDNASLDTTEAICREYAGSDSRIRYIRQIENLGAAANFQFVLNQSTSEYFMWAAADDLQEDTFLQELYDVITANHDIVCAMSDVVNIHESKPGIVSISCLSDIRLDAVQQSWPLQRKRFYRNPTSSIFFCVYGLFRVSILRRVKLFQSGFSKYLASSEVNFLAQLALYGPIVSIPKPLKIYRRHGQSMYHQEQLSFDFWKHMHRHSLVSLDLIVVISNCHLSVFSKLNLYGTVFSTWALGMISLFLRAIPASLRGKFKMLLHL